ncbi:energy-coupling factor transporter ATPase [bacterium D16-34]|nr:energy-coupling factor transporter ATPase [bacterium D16-34]
MSLIEFQDVSFTYDGETFALKDINLSIEQGEFVCILGGNGSGKSTLAKHINALLLPDKGSVVVLGHDTQDQTMTYFIRSHAGMVFQNPDDQLVANLVENDVAFGPENLSVPTDELRVRVSDALANVGLQGFDARETASLSGGQKQRVAIAGVLAMQPQILILDEATAMLDPRGRKGLMRVCRELNEQGMTIVMITHYMDEAAQAKRVIVLDAGKVACQGSPQEVLTQHELLERLHLDLPFAAELSYALKRAGIPVHTTVDTDSLKEELCALASKA